MAEFGELTEVPQPSLPGGVPSKQQLRSPLQVQDSYCRVEDWGPSREDPAL